MSIEQHLIAIKVFSGQWRVLKGPAIHVVTGQQDNPTCKEGVYTQKCCTHLIASSVPAGLLGNVVDWKFLFPTYPCYPCYSYSDCRETLSCKIADV